VASQFCLFAEWVDRLICDKSYPLSPLGLLHTCYTFVPVVSVKQMFPCIEWEFTVALYLVGTRTGKQKRQKNSCTLKVFFKSNFFIFLLSFLFLKAVISSPIQEWKRSWRKDFWETRVT